MKLKTVMHQTELCVIGGGFGGMLTAIAAARHGTKVVLMHDRPVLGGNASSEIRMWICGAGTRVRNLRETGIMEEILLENMHRNPERNYSIWDSILYEMVQKEANITLLLNCSCCDAEMNGNRIKSIKGFQLTTYTWHQIEAEIFADCSGDSILADLTGAEYMVGRESAKEYDEEFGLKEADRKTMGMSLMIQARETDHKCVYTPPTWAYTFRTDEEMKNKPHDCLERIGTNFYWIELGGEYDTIHDTELIRDELLKIAFGVWDHVKNRGDHGADNWELEWIGFLPGKRESRRYVGDYILTQNDVESCPEFWDEVAYGGWQIDNHLPGGFFMDGKAGNHLQKRRLTEPYGIPLRSLYSRNVENLMFAGRNISATHVAFSSARVMGTVGIIGQAVGTAATVAIKNGLTPRAVCQQKIDEIQGILLEDDCFLPHHRRKIAPLSAQAKLSCDYGDCGVLHNGMERRIWGNDNGYYGRINQAVTYTFEEMTHIKEFRLVVDSDLDRECIEGNPEVVQYNMILLRPTSYDNTSFGFPKCMVKSFRIDVMDNEGNWACVYTETDNHQRFIREKLDVTAKAIRFVPLSTYASEMVSETYGSATAHIFAFEVC